MTDTATGIDARPAHFSNYTDVLAHLDSLNHFHMDLTLTRVTQVLDTLELLRPEYAVAHIVGTNGKGSTAVFMTSLANAAGLSVGLFTSPHFLSPRERILVDGNMLDEEDWLLLANDIIEAGGHCLTYFEFVTVLAALAFADHEVDLAVFEAGLGGTYDATTAIAADTVLFTPMALDHEQILGPCLEDIARNKAGAVRRQTPVVTTVQRQEALRIIQDACASQDAPLHHADSTILPQDVTLALQGPHQVRNAALALAGLQTLMDHRGIPRPALIPWNDVVTLGLAHAWLPGRMQHISATEAHPAVIVDGGHNLHGLTALYEALNTAKIRPAAIIFAAMQDKNLHSMPALLASMTDGPIWLPALEQCSRAMPPAQLAKILAPNFTDSCRLRPCTSVADALCQAMTLPVDSPILICGSLFLAAEFFTLHPEYITA